MKFGKSSARSVAQCLVFLIAVSFVFGPPISIKAQEVSTSPANEHPQPTEQVILPETSEPVTEEKTAETAAPQVPADESLDKNAPAEEQKTEAESLSSPVIGPASLLGDISENKNRLAPEVGNISGALVYQYNIVVPPGRNKITPEVSLEYNSANASDDSIVGAGWSLSIPAIQRLNKDGSEKLYTENYYTSSFDGELLSLGNGAYVAKDENGDFRKYSLANNAWTVTDKAGTVYKFGTNIAERQDNPADSNKIFKWMLQEVRDTNDNYIKYEYYKDAGQIYPSKIMYTGNGNTDGIFEVNFDRSIRAASPKFFHTGFSVQSNYRITEIRTEVNNVWARKYTLAYTTGDNASGSILNTITESGQDDSANIVTLPAIDFNYTSAATDWTYNSAWALPLPFIFNGGVDRGMRMGDINGDGLPDIMCHNDNESGGTCYKNAPEVYLNDGDGTWTDVSSTWLFPLVGGTGSLREAFVDSNYADLGLNIIDVNGDLKVDLVRGDGPTKYVYINNGSGWTYDPGWVLPLSFFTAGVDFGMRMGDINGDGLPDIVCHNDKTKGLCYRNQPEIWINNGSGWTDASTTWLFPDMADNGAKKEAFLGETGEDRGLRLVDVNGDGLADLVRADGAQKYTYINNGSGWTYDSSWIMPLPFINGSNDSGVRLADINGDGLSDVICHTRADSGSCGLSNPQAYINTGTGWADVSTAWVFPVKAWDAPTLEIFLDSNFTDDGLRVMDVNGDRMDDLVRGGCNSGCNYTYLNNEDTLSNLLTEVVHPQGGTTAVTYKATPLFKSGSTLLNPKMPIISHVVSQVSNNDGLGTTETNTYEYQDGEYYFNTYLDRKFSGFNKVTKTTTAGHKTINYYHQGNSTDAANGEYSDHASKISKAYRTEIQDGSGNVFSKTVNLWDKYDLGSGRNFVKNIRTTELAYDGDADHKDKATEYSYDNTFGNLTQLTEWGEVTASSDGTFTDTGTDKFTTTISYVDNAIQYIVGLPSQDTKVDQRSNKVKENRYYYDLQALGGVTKGNLTKQEMWKTGSTYTDTEKTYNITYGIVTQEKDPRDKATNYSYDSYNLYPTTVTNALSQVTTYIYDYSSGQVKTTTDPNTRMSETVYDGLDRPLMVKQPDLITPSTLVTKTAYVYTDTSGAVKVQQTDYLDGSTSVDTYTYFDGLARPIQTRKEMEDSNTFAVTDSIYNSLGKVHQESLPYSSAGTAKTAVTTAANLLTTYSYDPMMRVTSTVNSIGTISNAYDNWTVTVTDARGKPKDFYYDARGNLIRVDEHNATSTYITAYEYNGNNNLTKITDALGNVRNFAYDGLGRRLTAQDLHDPADATFGIWTYTYDDAGNLSSTVDPKSQTVNYTYDDLNRQLTEDYTGQSGTEISYSYDSGTDGVGRLTSVTAPGANTTYAYNPVGGLKQEVKTINGTGYQTDYTYDRQGNQLEITNPDSSKIKYAYNTAGQLETVQRKESIDGSFINVVTDFDYGPHGKVTYQTFQNGAATTNTYDTNKLYRLNGKITTIGGGSKMQDLTYTYDNSGNITQIVDASNTNSSKTVAYTYDDLNRLISATATGVASGQSTYSETYTYTAIGNILTKAATVGGGATTTSTYTYAGNTGSGYANPHAVTSISDGVTTTNYSYDNNGNMIAEGSKTFTFNYNNRMTQSVTGGGGGSPTTTSFYAASGDGAIYGQNSSWDTAHDAITGNAVDNGTTGYVRTGKNSSTSYRIERAFLPFDTSALPDGATITDTKLKVYAYSKENDDNDGDDWITVVQTSQPSTSGLTTADYELAGSINNPVEGVDIGQRKDITSISTGAYLTFTLNATGRGWVNTSGATQLGLREGHDVIDSTFSGSLLDYNSMRIRMSGYSGTSYDPILEVTYITGGSSVTVNYAYDHTGQRVKLDNGTTTTIYPSKYYNTDGTTPIKHIMTPDGQNIATTKGTGGSAVTFSNHTDHLTGSNVITNSSGTLEELMDYFPYGGIRLDQQSGAFNEQRKYTGHEYDVDTGLVYANARYYNSAIGRFISQDPLFWDMPGEYLIDPQQWNSYSYARNNPINRLDPTGLLNIKTGQVEKGDTQDGIVNSINSAFGIKTNWDTVRNVSFYGDRFGDKSLNDIVGQSLFIGTDLTTDVTSQLDKLNYDRSKTAFWIGPGAAMYNFAPGKRWDIKNSNDPVLGGGSEDRNYWSYIYHGELIRYDAPGNINFGYVSRSLGLPTSVILGGAGAQQVGDNIRKGNFSNGKDNSGDAKYIKQGINLYKTTGPKWIRFFNSW